MITNIDWTARNRDKVNYLKMILQSLFFSPMLQRKQNVPLPQPNCGKTKLDSTLVQTSCWSTEQQQIYSLFSLIHENMQTSFTDHMACQVSTVLHKTLSRRNRPCSAIGGAETLPFSSQCPPSSSLLTPVSMWPKLWEGRHIPMSPTLPLYLEFHYSSIGWKLPNHNSDHYTFPLTVALHDDII